jgi:hypothetical protein
VEGLKGVKIAAGAASTRAGSTVGGMGRGGAEEALRADELGTEPTNVYYRYSSLEESIPLSLVMLLEINHLSKVRLVLAREAPFNSKNSAIDLRESSLKKSTSRLRGAGLGELNLASKVGPLAQAKEAVAEDRVRRKPLLQKSSILQEHHSKLL